jgi:hypothetical protein
MTLRRLFNDVVAFLDYHQKHGFCGYFAEICSGIALSKFFLFFPSHVRPITLYFLIQICRNWSGAAILFRKRD